MCARACVCFSVRTRVCVYGMFVQDVAAHLGVGGVEVGGMVIDDDSSPPFKLLEASSWSPTVRACVRVCVCVCVW